jgi:hypothetical protein
LTKFIAITLYIIFLAPFLAIMIGEPISRFFGLDPFADMFVQIAVFGLLCLPLKLLMSKREPEQQQDVS